MKLFIVESPSKCVTLRKYLGSDYKIVASVGHIRSIPKKGLNIDIKNNFTPKFEISKDRKKIVKELKELAEKADEIILATDPDREGEAISWHIYDLLSKKNQKKCVRASFNEISKKAVHDAIANSSDIDYNKVDSQKARQVLDRLIGYKVSPLLWFTVGSGTSAGRVQSVVLKLICHKQKEIENFKPVDYWYIESLLKNENGEFWAKVVTKDKDNRYLDEKASKEDFEKLKEAIYTVEKVEKKEKVSKANAPFDTTSLQTTCSGLFGWNATRSSKVAQTLYEQGKVTYIRSDSFAISADALKEVRGLIGKASTKEYLPKSPNVYVKKAGASQEAHECIRPTDVYDKGDDIDDSSESKMYKLIRDRFIACQMSPMVLDTVSYQIKTDTKHTLVAKGQAIKFDGWFKVYKYSKTKEEVLPVVKEKEKLELADIKNEKHTTKPPPRYSDGSLLKIMDKEDVGRPSTRAGIIKSIQDKGYVEKEKGNKGGFVATPLGIKVCEYLEPNFKDFFMDIKYTAALEEDLNLIAEGKKTFIEVVQSTYDILKEHIKETKDNPPPKKEHVSTGEECTVCEKGEIVEKDGRFGTFFSCNNYPTCKTIYVQDDDGEFSVKKKAVVKKVGRNCPDCEKYGRDGELVERKKKKDDSVFIGCNAFPKCKYVESI